MLRGASNFVFAAIAAGAIACSSTKSDAPPAVVDNPICADGTTGCVGWQTCPPEFTPDPDLGCTEIVPPKACAAGTMAVLGSADCKAVGPAACSDGIVPSATGWGCDVVLPAASCTGATRDVIGSSTCAPVGDCNAAFPPANATYFVDATYTGGQLDATHFATISDAITAAPANAVIAIAAGTYAENILAVRTVSIVGQCADRVHLVGTGRLDVGLYVNGITGVTVSGITLQDHDGGVRVSAGGSATLTDVVVEAPRSYGLGSISPGSVLHAERVVVRNAQPVGGLVSSNVLSANADLGGDMELVDSVIEGSYSAGVVATNENDAAHTSTIRLEHSVVRDTNIVEHSTAGAGVVASDHSHIDIVSSAVVNARRLSMIADGAPASLVVTGSVMRTTLDDSTGDAAGALLAFDGASVDITDTSIRDVADSAITAEGKGTVVGLHRSVIEATRPSLKFGIFGIGATADTGASLNADATAFIGNSYQGVSLTDAHTTATLSNVLVSGTLRPGANGLGRGIDVANGASGTFDRVTLVANGDQSLYIHDESTGGSRSSATVTRLLVMDTVPGPDGTLGSGISIERGGLLSLDGAVVARAHNAGIVVSTTVGTTSGVTSEASLTHVVVRDTAGGHDAAPTQGRESLSGPGILCGGTLTVASTAITGSLEFGLYAANPTAVVSVANTVITNTTPGSATGNYGHGLVATNGASLVVRDSILRSNVIGVAFSEAPGIVASSLIQDNTVGIVVEGADYALVTAAAAPDAIAANTVVVTSDSRFVDNQSRVGNNVIPLPSGDLPPDAKTAGP